MHPGRRHRTSVPQSGASLQTTHRFTVRAPPLLHGRGTRRARAAVYAAARPWASRWPARMDGPASSQSNYPGPCTADITVLSISNSRRIESSLAYRIESTHPHLSLRLHATHTRAQLSSLDPDMQASRFMAGGLIALVYAAWSTRGPRGRTRVAPETRMMSPKGVLPRHDPTDMIWAYGIRVRKRMDGTHGRLEEEKGPAKTGRIRDKEITACTIMHTRAEERQTRAVYNSTGDAHKWQDIPCSAAIKTPDGMKEIERGRQDRKARLRAENEAQRRPSTQSRRSDGSGGYDATDERP
ncbi:hypothetical protein EVG20_g10751 [Dentipellis fragilis]|uniref:Uncharacterized protein n=1 Tax=Dentipellis fragilis TaxID=205917 RepID=A0A4Y9XPG3_9AGAM|nr:hypothetical protein EVG20_g10751 [Dentipellis fragilis]